MPITNSTAYIIEEGDSIQLILFKSLSQVFMGFLNALPGIFAAVILLLIFLAIALVLRKVVNAVFKKGKYDESTSMLFSRLAYYAVIVVGVIASFSVGGVDLAALMISFGMIGFAVGFALKDIISNFLGGILIFIYKPFVIGNAILVKEFSGTVEKIDVRATEIKTFDGLKVIIPNSDMIANPVTNYTLSTMRRIMIPVGIGCEDDLSKAYDITLESINELEETLETPSPVVAIDGFGESTINLIIWFWVDTTKFNLSKAKSKAIKLIKDKYEQEGIEMPFPIRTIIQKKSDQ